MATERRRRLGALVGSVAGFAVVFGCSGGGSDDAAPAETLPPTTETQGGCDLVPIAVADPLPAGTAGTAPTLPPGVDTGYAGGGPGSGNPYVVPGARQVPGPDMTVTTLGPEPVSIAVAVPPNPDVGHPSTRPPTATTQPTPPTTLPPEATTSTSSPDGSLTPSTLMGLADDPGCVARPGDP